MQAAIDIFLNGVLGVFAGLAVLYVAIKIIRLAAGREPERKKED